MKVTYTSRDGRFVVEFEADTQVDLFEQIAGFQEVFEQNVCSAKFKGELIQSDLVRFSVREDKEGNKYYEKVCEDWDKGLVGFKHSYGCKKKGGGLFPKDMPEENRIPGLNGWYLYKKPDTEKNTKQDKSEPTPF